MLCEPVGLFCIKGAIGSGELFTTTEVFVSSGDGQNTAIAAMTSVMPKSIFSVLPSLGSLANICIINHPWRR